MDISSKMEFRRMAKELADKHQVGLGPRGIDMLAQVIEKHETMTQRIQDILEGRKLTPQAEGYEAEDDRDIALRALNNIEDIIAGG